jgi:hypothetical protein
MESGGEKYRHIKGYPPTSTTTNGNEWKPISSLNPTPALPQTEDEMEMPEDEMEMLWIRTPEHDRRFAWGDDYAGDGWQHRHTGEIRWTVVGFDLNGVASPALKTHKDKGPYE